MMPINLTLAELRADLERVTGERDTHLENLGLALGAMEKLNARPSRPASDPHPDEMDDTERGYCGIGHALDAQEVTG